MMGSRSQRFVSNFFRIIGVFFSRICSAENPPLDSRPFIAASV